MGTEVGSGKQQVKNQVCPTLGCCRVSVTTEIPLLPKLPWSSGAVTVAGSVSCLCNTPLQSTAPGTAAGSEHWLVGGIFCLCCCKPAVVSILDVSSCFQAEASSPMPLDSLLLGAMGLPTTLFWSRDAQSSPCPGDEFIACSRRHWDCQTPKGAGPTKTNPKNTQCNNETQL